MLSWMKWFKPWTSRDGRRQAVLPRKLFLEALEDRTLLAAVDFLWQPPAKPTNLDWSTAADWRVFDPLMPNDPTKPAAQSPTANDNVFFTKASNNANATVDRGTKKVANMVIEAGYGGKITLDSTLNILGKLTMQGGTIDGGNNLNLKDMDWNAGTLSGKGETDVSNTLILSGGGLKKANPTLDARWFKLLGTGKFTHGSLELMNGAQFFVEKQFQVKSAFNPKLNPAVNSTGAKRSAFIIENKGIVSVDLNGNETFKVSGIDFQNKNGKLNVISGTMELVGGSLSNSGEIALSDALKRGLAAITLSPDPNAYATNFDLLDGTSITGLGKININGFMDADMKDHCASLNVKTTKTLTLVKGITLNIHYGNLTGPGTLILKDTQANFVAGWLWNNEGAAPITLDVTGDSQVFFTRGQDAEHHSLYPGMDEKTVLNLQGAKAQAIFTTDPLQPADSFQQPGQQLKMYMGESSKINVDQGSVNLQGQINILPWRLTPKSTAPSITLTNKGNIHKILAAQGKVTSTIDAAIDRINNNVQGGLIVDPGAGLFQHGPFKQDPDGNKPPANKKQGASLLGPFDFAPATVTALAAADWVGNGVFTMPSVVNAGLIYPGGSLGQLGTLTFASALQLQPTSVVQEEIDGTATTNYDQVQVTGLATLAGSLSITTNGYTPSLGDTFKVLDLPGGYTGTFSSISLPTLPSGYGFQVLYDPLDVSLKVVTASTSAPSLGSLSASSGSTAGGTSLTITGSNFTNVQSVLFGSTPAQSFTVNSSTSITAVAPASAAGLVDLRVVTAAGTSPVVAADQYTYTLGSVPAVSALSPSTGYLSGGTAVTITGTGFTGATQVAFGSATAPYFVVNSDTSITAYAPAATSAGSNDVRVTNYAGTSPVVTADQYTYTQQPAPTVTGVSPTSGSTAGNTSVTITGTTFANVSAVYFGSTSVPFTVNSATSISVTSPPDAAGTVDITVQTDGGSSALSAADRYTFTVAPTPAITTLSTTSGSAAGGTVVTLTGTALTSAQAVLVGGTPASFSVLSDTSLAFVTPAGATGPVHVQVFTPSGSSPQTSADLFTYTAASTPTVAALSLTGGPTAGGSTVTLTGTGFTAASAVSFGSYPAASFTVLSDTSLVAVAPPQAAGTVDLTVTAPGGTSATSTADRFTYTASPAPTVSKLDVSGGPTTGGTAVTLTGANFTGASSVQFGTASAYFTVLDDNTIQAFAPAGTAGTVDVTVTTFSATSATSSADRFSYSTAALPAVTGLSATTGSTAGGTQVVLTGSGFSGVGEVDFGSVPVFNFTVNSDTQLTVLAPAQAAGTVDVTVASAAGTSLPSLATRFSYTLAATPTVTSLGTTTGTNAGGTTVLINGSGFTAATAVSFGTVPADSFTVLSDTQISAVSPAQAAGTFDVRVFGYAGSSAPVTADQYTVTTAPAPAVTALATTGGSTGGGTLVTLTGTGFTGVSAVSFGTVSASFTWNSPTSISAWAPPQAAGTVNVTVSTPSGTSAAASGNQFTYTAAAAPVLNSLLGTSGSTAGGAAVTILGSHFLGTSAVTFGGVAAAYTILDDNTLVATAPMLPAGTVAVAVTTPSGTGTLSSAFTVTGITAPAPAVSGLDLTTGSTAGGQTVTLTGSNFTGTSAVAFGNTAATSFTVLSDTQISAVAPAGSAGTVDLRVTTNNGTSPTGSADQFTYLSTPAPAVTALGTTSGSTAGGTSIILTGTNFSGASAVSFGGTPATSFLVNSDSSITAVSPAGYAGTLDLTVTTPSGTSATGTADQFTYTAAAAPAITSLSATSGSTAGGTTLTISGTDFGGTTAVTFGGLPATFTMVSGTQLSVVTPASTSGTIDVVVTTTAGTSAPSSAARFTFTAANPPAITALGTTTGSSAGGTTVVLTGTDFTGASAVLFGTLPAASFTVDSPTQITAVSPAQAAGQVNVSVVTPTGNSAASSSTSFTYAAAAAPAVTALSTTGGTTAGGTAVTITGTGFTAASQVLFGTVPAAYTVNSDTSITATAPSQAAGTVDVTVTTPSGTSATGSADRFAYTAAAAPTVTALSTTSGSAAGGTALVVSGSGFTGATSVSFGSTAATFQVLSDSAIQVSAPAGAGTIDVTVTTPSGTSATGTADQYTYAAVTAPTVTALSATTGSTGGGTVLTLTGTGLLGTTGVTFGGVSATFTVVSDTSLLVTTPADTAGSVDMVVTVPGAQSAPARFTFTAAAAPAVTGLSATTGSTAGGTAITVTGTGFTGAAAVLFGQTAVPFTLLSDTSITLTSPAAAAAGPVDLTVDTPTGTSAVGTADQFTYTAAAAPTLIAVSPGSGPAAGGTVVNLTGTGFTAASAVNFGTLPASFTVQSDTWITATVPASSAGTVAVTVSTAGGTSAGLNFSYSAPAAPTVNGLTTATGSTAGGFTTTISGTGFTAATAVSFGTAQASFTVLSDSSISASVPAGSAGTIDVQVTTAGGTSATCTADQFTYATPAAPTVTGLSASSGSGAGGTVVEITGTNFSGASAVSFGTVSAASFVVNSPTQITAVSPAQVAGTIDVTVVTPGGTSATSSADQFTDTATAAPALTAVSPAAGPLAGNNNVLVTGSGFTGASNVTFGSASALGFQVLNDTTLIATAPAGSAGSIDVRVTTPAGTSAVVAADTYAYQATPTLTSISPSTDTATGGIQVTLTGTGFTGATAVYFGNAAAPALVVNSDTSITATVPANPVGTVNVTVYAPGGFSGSQAFTYSAATSASWVGGDGDWDTASSWSTGAVPTATTDATIPAGVTVTHNWMMSDSVHQLTVNGTLSFGNGALTVNATSTLANLTLANGTLTASGAVTVTGNLDWTGGILQAGGGVTVAAGGTATLGSGNGSGTLSGGTLANLGAATLGFGTLTLSSATLDNRAGATLTSSGSAYSRNLTGSTTGTVLNEGTFNQSGATTAFGSGVTFSNTGTVNVTAGTLALYGGSNAGAVAISAGCAMTISGSFTLAATSSITGAGSMTLYDGVTSLGGTFNLSGGLTIASGGALSGSGTITGNVTNNGTLYVGGSGSIGTMTINGNYTQGSTGVLTMDIASASSFDRLNITGTATLGGTLNVSTINSYTPPSGTAFTLLTFASSTGTFSTVNSSLATNHYNATDFTEVARAEIDPFAEESPAEEDAPRREKEGRAVFATADFVAPAVSEPLSLTATPAADWIFACLSEAAVLDTAEAPADEGTGWPEQPLLDLAALPLALLDAIFEAIL